MFALKPSRRKSCLDREKKPGTKAKTDLLSAGPSALQRVKLEEGSVEDRKVVIDEIPRCPEGASAVPNSSTAAKRLVQAIGGAEKKKRFVIGKTRLDQAKK